MTKIKKGTVTLGDLVAGGATQLGCVDFGHERFPAGFPRNGNWTPIEGSSPPTPGVYAVSVPGVLASSCISWFQSQQACLLSDKRLLTNAEWQAAAAGTPDPGDDDDGTTTCVTQSGSFGLPALAGSRSSCTSNWGASDMVGNVWEWVADWVPRSTACPRWGIGDFSDDSMCLAGASETLGPGALIRGGAWASGTDAGVFAVSGRELPSSPVFGIGLRCAR